MSLTLYAHPFSSYCQKVLIALYENDTAFELRLLAGDERMLDRFFDNYVMTPMQKIVRDASRAPAQRDPQGVGEARALLDASYRWLDAALSGREWAAGDAFGLADCAAAPALFYADWVARSARPD